MTSENSIGTAESTGRLFIPALAISVFAVSISMPMLGLLTSDMATTFFGNAEPAAIGIVAQLSTVDTLAEMVFALLLAFFALRLKHKPVLLAGMVILAISAIGSFFAPTLLWLQFFYLVEGIGTVMVNIMAFTLIGRFVPTQKKAKAVSYLLAVTALVSLLGPLIINYITKVDGWRYNYLWFVLPVVGASLLLAFAKIPSRSDNNPTTPSGNAYLGSLKQVLLNKSALACMIGGMLSGGLMAGIFSIAFYRNQFLVSRDFATGIVIASTVMFILATLVAGRLANRLGARTLTITGTAAGSILLLIYFWIPNLWVTLILDMTHVFFAVVAFTALSTLYLDQAPKSRGTMMSFRSVFGNLGGVIGTVVGGAMLAYFVSYQAVGFALGALGLVATAVFFFAKDPNKT